MSEECKKRRVSYIRKCLDKKTAYSAQRLAGLIGWLFVIIFLLIGTFWDFNLPGTFELFMIISAALLGLDTLAEIVAAYKGTGFLGVENPFTGNDFGTEIDNAIESAFPDDGITTEGNFSYANRCGYGNGYGMNYKQNNTPRP